MSAGIERIKCARLVAQLVTVRRNCTHARVRLLSTHPVGIAIAGILSSAGTNKSTAGPSLKSSRIIQIKRRVTRIPRVVCSRLLVIATAVKVLPANNDDVLHSDACRVPRLFCSPRNLSNPQVRSFIDEISLGRKYAGGGQELCAHVVGGISAKPSLCTTTLYVHPARCIG
jgi:hypothetical protein